MAAAERKRGVVGEMARQRAEAAALGASSLDGSSPRTALSAGYFTGDQAIAAMGRFQLKEAQRELREHQNKLQLREVLAAQAAEKRMRELREHASTYGEPPDAGPTLARIASKGALGPSPSEARTLAGAARRKELEGAILQKQRERHELRKVAREEQRQLDDAAVQEEVLVYQRDAYRKREQQTEIALALTKQDAARRRQTAKEEYP